MLSAILACAHRSALCGHRPLRSPICSVRSPTTRCAHWSCAVTDHSADWWAHRVIGDRTGQVGERTEWSVTAHGRSVSVPSGRWLHRADRWAHRVVGDRTGQVGERTEWSMTAQGRSVSAPSGRWPHRADRWAHRVIAHHTGQIGKRTLRSLTTFLIGNRRVV